MKTGLLLQKLAAWLLTFGPLGIFFLSLIDSAGLPVPEGADLLLVWYAARQPDAAWAVAAIAVAGSVGGNSILFLLARRGGRRFRESVPEPGSRSQRFRDWFHRYGLVTVFIPCLLPAPLPLKVFVISAGVLHARFLTFLLVVTAARVPRYFGLAYMGRKLGQESYGFFTHNALALLGVAVALGLGLLLLVRLNDRRRRSRAAPHDILGS